MYRLGLRGCSLCRSARSFFVGVGAHRRSHRGRTWRVGKDAMAKNSQQDRNAQSYHQEKGVAQLPIVLACLFYPYGQFLQFLLLAAVPGFELFNER